MTKLKILSVTLAIISAISFTGCSDSDSSSETASNKFEPGSVFDSSSEYYGVDVPSGTVFKISEGEWTAASRATHFKHEGNLGDSKLQCTHDNKNDIEYEILQNDMLEITMDGSTFKLTSASKQDYASLAQIVLSDTVYSDETYKPKQTVTVEIDPDIPETTATDDSSEAPEETTTTTTTVITTEDKSKLTPEELARDTIGYFSDADGKFLLHIEDSGKDDNIVTVELQVLRTNPLYYSSEPGGFDEVYYLGNSYDLNAKWGDKYTYKMTLDSGARDPVVDIAWSVTDAKTITCKIKHVSHNGTYEEELEMHG